jgi:hypothetical protein
MDIKYKGKLPVKKFKTYVVVMSATVGLVVGLSTLASNSETRLEYQGIYSSEQALRGKPEFYSYCASCHNNEQFFNNAIKQRVDQPVIYLFEEIITTMPMNAPGFLRDELYEDIFAYLLQNAGLPADDTDLTYTIMKQNDFRF